MAGLTVFIVLRFVKSHPGPGDARINQSREGWRNARMYMLLTYIERSRIFASSLPASLVENVENAQQPKAGFAFLQR